MISRRLTLLAAIGGVVSGSLPTLAASDFELMAQLDKDHDATVDLNEAKSAAATLFDRLDRDHDGTLTRHELSGRLSVKELAGADPDHDRTISKDEYLALVEQRFKAADRDNDGTVSAAELRTKSGRSMMRLLK